MMPDDRRTGSTQAPGPTEDNRGAIRMQLQEIPSVCLRSMLQGARWPLTAAEAVFRRTDGEGPSEWPPAIAYEAFAASSKQVVGSLVRHRPLVEEGRAQQAKVDKLRM